MTGIEIETSPPNSLIVVMDKVAVMDEGLGEFPDRFDPTRNVAATSWCVGIGTLAEPDGPTRITLGDEPPALAGKTLVFEGHLETPHQAIAVCNVLGEILLRWDVPTTRARIRVWTNHPTEPDEIDIVVCA